MLLVAFPLLGFLASRWLLLAAPATGWPVFYLGLNGGWWGSGTGDGWQAAMWSFTVIGVVTTALAIPIGKAVRQPRVRPRGHSTAH